MKVRVHAWWNPPVDKTTYEELGRLFYIITAYCSSISIEFADAEGIIMQCSALDEQAARALLGTLKILPRFRRVRVKAGLMQDESVPVPQERRVASAG